MFQNIKFEYRMEGNKVKRLCMAMNCHASGLQDFDNLYRFPKNPELKQKWLENLGLTRDRMLSSSRSLICQRHFTAACRGKKRLFSWAVPTLNLGTGSTKKLHQPIKPKDLLRKCCVKNCNSKPPEILHAFPMKTDTRRNWLKLCGLSDMRKGYYICQRHFSARFLHGNKLLPDAYPDLSIEDPIEMEEYNYENDADNEPEIDTKFSNADDDSFDQPCEGNCINSVNTDNKCAEMQKEMDAMRKRIKLLEKLLDQNNDSEEEEYIWMLLK
ncbi:uncharacterized protein LOC108659234 [Drosophila navojoa]|uniref:uncharacterized protein LOC108659234 n=1 Tax=Drosophila navojoa TaxID=7232 RepID=UPI0008467144|nr:uncharacterized protein LOC108659234 [Drosophila navojoa]